MTDVLSHVAQAVRLLKQNAAGRIVWLNVCAQLCEGAIDHRAVAGVLVRSFEAFSASYPTIAPPDPAAAFMAEMLDQAHDNDVAIAAIRRVDAPPAGSLDELRTVLRGVDLWQHYLEGVPEAYVQFMDAIGWRTGALEDIDGARMRELLCEECARRGGDVKAQFASVARQSYLRTGAPRFWVSLPSAERPTDVHELLCKLGVMGFEKDQWVVEVALNRADLDRHFGAAAVETLRRPSALCAIDASTPRFRGLLPSEIGSLLRGTALNPFGQTVSLHAWSQTEGSERSGLPELICPQIIWRSDLLPSRITLLGRCPSDIQVPDNEGYSAYLEVLYESAVEQEPEIVGALERCLESTA